ncbi:LacI family DNA-binding transcriptional regulator [Okibacterium endophyticum]
MDKSKLIGRASMADVGRLADVSAQTVSRYFTGGYVSAQTRMRIESAVKQLGYRHNRLARNLRAERTDTIGLLIIGPLNYGNAELLTGVNSAAREANLSVISTQLGANPDASITAGDVEVALDHFLSFRVDGIIAGTQYAEIVKQLDEYSKAVAVVTLSEATGLSEDSASGDSYGAGRIVMDHLLDLGHHRIVHLGGPSGRIETAIRSRAYQDAMAAAGLQPMPELTCTEWNAASGAAQGSFADPTSFSAVFAANDALAFGFMGAMVQRGYRAPDHYSIVSIDDMPDSAYFSPPLTTARIDFKELGRSAIEILAERIRTGAKQPHRTIPATLTIRRSTAPATK